MFESFIVLLCASGIFTVMCSFENSTLLTVVPRTITSSSDYFDAFAIQGMPLEIAHDISNNRRFTSRTLKHENNNVKYKSCCVDYPQKILYLYDYYLGQIQRVNYFDWIYNYKSSAVTVHSGLSRSDVQIAVDWISQNLYWTDPLYRWIAMQPARSDTVDTSLYRVVITDNLERPYGLAVDPIHKYIFWSDIGTIIKIERASLTGSNRTTLISRGLITPMSIDTDLTTSRIYWADSTKDTIESSDYDGGDRRTLRRLTHTDFINVAVSGKAVSAVDSSDGRFKIMTKDTGDYVNYVSLRTGDFHFEGVTIFHSDKQPKTTEFCSNATCSDLCVSGTSRAECLCKEGYQLNSDGFSCSESNGQFHRALVLTNATTICLLDIRSLSTRAHIGNHDCFYTSKKNIDYIDIDAVERKMVYATDLNIYAVNIGNIPVTQKLISTTNVITGLALDWVSKAVYWSMGDTGGSINKLSQDTLAEIEILKGIQYPRDIEVMPHERMMVWISGKDGNYSINKAYMNGTNITTVVDSNDLYKPVTLTLDLPRMIIFWSDNGNVRRCNLDGTNLQTLGHINSPNLLFAYKNYLVVTRNLFSTTMIQTLDIDDPTIEQPDFTFSNIGIVKSVKVLDSYLQPQQKGPCGVQNGGCEHVCIQGGASRTCKCEFGFKLESDNKACSSTLMTDNFILVTDSTHNKVYQVSLDTADVRVLDSDSTGIPTGMTFNHVTKQIIWGDSFSKTIKIIGIDGTGYKILGNPGLYGSFPERFAVDITSGNVYYSLVSDTHEGFTGIGVIAKNGAHRKLMQTDGRPFAIAVDPANGLLFWTETKDNLASVKKANMDGSSVTSIIDKNIRVPNGIAIDYEAVGLWQNYMNASEIVYCVVFNGEKRFYLTDGTLNTIQSCTYTGSCRVFHTDKVRHVMDVQLLGDYLYYTAKNYHFITKLHKYDSSGISRLATDPEFGRLDSLVVYKSSDVSQSISTACLANNGLGKCNTFCLPTSFGFTCACEDDVDLRNDGVTCENVYITNISTTTSTSATTVVTPAAEQGGSSAVYIIVAATVGIILIIAVLIVGIVIYRRRTMQAQDSQRSNIFNNDIFELPLSTSHAVDPDKHDDGYDVIGNLNERGNHYETLQKADTDGEYLSPASDGEDLSPASDGEYIIPVNDGKVPKSPRTVSATSIQQSSDEYVSLQPEPSATTIQ